MGDSHKMSDLFKSNKLTIEHRRNYLTEFDKNQENSGDKYPLKSLDFYNFYTHHTHFELTTYINFEFYNSKDNRDRTRKVAAFLGDTSYKQKPSPIAVLTQRH